MRWDGHVTRVGQMRSWKTWRKETTRKI